MSSLGEMAAVTIPNPLHLIVKKEPSLKMHVNIGGNACRDDPHSPPPNRREGAKPQEACPHCGERPLWRSPLPSTSSSRSLKTHVEIGWNGCCDDPNSTPLHHQDQQRLKLSRALHSPQFRRVRDLVTNWPKLCFRNLIDIWWNLYATLTENNFYLESI